MVPQTKLALALVAETTFFFGQTADPGFLTAGAFDKGTTVVGLLILLYMFKLVLTGDWIHKEQADARAIVSGREAALTVLREQKHDGA